MKKLLTLLFAITAFSFCFATTVIEVKPVFRADQFFIPTNKTGGKISLMELSQIKIKDFEKLRGEKMNFFDRITFKAAQKKVRDNINNDGTINNKKLNKFLSKSGETGFHLGGFALGFLLGLIGILIAYLIKDDYKRNRVKWSWIGFGIYLVIFIIIAASGGFAIY